VRGGELDNCRVEGGVECSVISVSWNSGAVAPCSGRLITLLLVDSMRPRRGLPRFGGAYEGKLSIPELCGVIIERLELGRWGGDGGARFLFEVEIMS
jgi:hypothetical protein